ncbi:MAG: hypothetical protein Q9195_001079 [Heterodermia aff. obscurata]
MPSSSPTNSQEFWIFGYGSLIWKPPPHYGYITGYVRRFWQASEDHRGTPTSPGRVVTLIEQSYYDNLIDPEQAPSPPKPVWGAAYRIPPQHVSKVSAYLDIREINGYSIQYTDFHRSSSSSSASATEVPEVIFSEETGKGCIRCLVYIGLPSNPQFLGVQSADDVAEVIWHSRGPSGENREYLFMLESALEGLGEGSGDGHVSDLARRVRALQGVGGAEGTAGDKTDGEAGPRPEGVVAAIAPEDAIGTELEKVRSGARGSHEVQEEIEKL